eukprot:m.13885 g.13885  ORF g.13885 m.13885 type:complete len:65 (-) comp7662_c0_seq1:273-467(-)
MEKDSCDVESGSGRLCVLEQVNELETLLEKLVPLIISYEKESAQVDEVEGYSLQTFRYCLFVWL